MSSITIHMQLEQFKSAIDTFLEGVRKPELSDLERDGVVQRFEYTFEYSRKTLKKVLIFLQIDTENYPRAVFKKAHESWLLDWIEIWLDLLDARNMLSHTYSENTAEHIFDQVIVRYADVFQSLYDSLSEIVSQHES